MLKNLLKSIVEEINNCTQTELILIATVVGLLSLCYMLRGVEAISQNLPY